MTQNNSTEIQSQKKYLVVIPTYNEKDNISLLLEAIFKQDFAQKNIPAENVHVLVVDDSSPDKTYEIVRQYSKSEPRVHLLLRTNKEGLGRAYVAGFQWGMQNDFDHIIEMDADFSHEPRSLVDLMSALQHSDFVVGSRYVQGGGTKNWGLGRKLISKGGSLYSRWILGYPLNDWTGGFNAWRSTVLQSIGVENIQSNGYSFQIELKYRALKKGFRGFEAPILFEDRRVGQSKMSFKIVAEAFYRVWWFRFHV
jgi:dolichol-phosphate mannosyltransferase